MQEELIEVKETKDEDLEELANKLLAGERIRLSWKKWDDSEPGDPYFVIDHVYAEIRENENSPELKAIHVYLSKEDDDAVNGLHLVYRLPVIEEIDILKEVLKYARDQSHLYYWD
ncbi:hypothetical protein ACFL1H_02425 [Nanoarchaeota archaeon]